MKEINEIKAIMTTKPTTDTSKKEREAKKTIEKLQIYLKKNGSTNN
jgi:hypothetical protein